MQTRYFKEWNGKIIDDQNSKIGCNSSDQLQICRGQNSIHDSAEKWKMSNSLRFSFPSFSFDTMKEWERERERGGGDMDCELERGKKEMLFEQGLGAKQSVLICEVATG